VIVPARLSAKDQSHFLGCASRSSHSLHSAATTSRSRAARRHDLPAAGADRAVGQRRAESIPARMVITSVLTERRPLRAAARIIPA
jgi:hypothetical protein